MRKTTKLIVFSVLGIIGLSFILVNRSSSNYRAKQIALSDSHDTPIRSSRSYIREVDSTTSTSTTSTIVVTTTTTVRRVVTAAPAPRQVAAYSGTIDGMPALLRRIGGCESDGNPTGPLIWTAKNRRSSASGAFEYLSTTWNNYGGYSEARFAPPSIQVERAVADFNAESVGPWVASRSCWG